MSDATQRNLRLASAALGAALTLIAYYALDRTRAAVFSPGPDPALVIASERIDYFWRVAVCAYAAPLVFAAWWALARGRELRVWHALSKAIGPLVLVAALLALAFP